MKDLLKRLVPVPASGRLTGGLSPWDVLKQVQRKVEGLGNEEYRLIVNDGKITLEASTGAGMLYAGQTLRQLRLLSPRSCPHLVIEDEPAMIVRGYMLDISRNKVPTMQHLFRMVDLLAFLKFNQLQLYTEHTFAYAGHEDVWKDSSPLTAEEVQALKDYCADRFIELVPNQNAFGHMERWLKHDRYRYLAESPDGFHHPITGWRPEGTVLYPDQQAAQFIDSLLDQLLPNFDSHWVHLGCDEPWELGQGRSYERSLQVGRHGLYREHLLALHRLVSSRNKQMLFWSDELRTEPDRITELPEDMFPVVWGYERNHPFNEECQVYSNHGRSFLIAPGDSSWNSFTSRLDNAWQNIKHAASAAIEYGAMGMILTSWGDNGHQQVWPAQLPGLLVFSSAAWNPRQLDCLRMAQALDSLVFHDPNQRLGQFWDAFARLDSHIPLQILPQNSSFPFDALYQQAKTVASSFKGHSSDCLFSAFDHLSSCGKLLEQASPDCQDGQWLLEESQLAFDMTFAGMKRAESILKGSVSTFDLIDVGELPDRFAKIWLRRARQGGLGETLVRIRSCT